MHIALDENTHDFMLEMFEEYSARTWMAAGNLPPDWYDEWAFYDRFQDTYLYDHHHFEAVDLHYQEAF